MRSRRDQREGAKTQRWHTLGQLAGGTAVACLIVLLAAPLEAATRARSDNTVSAAPILTINRGRAAVKACYDRGLKRNPSLSGKLTAKIVLARGGSVSSVSISDETLGDAEVVGCVKASIRSWRFPPVAEAASSAVETTWVFAKAR
jgi:hypothetical protein